MQIDQANVVAIIPARGGSKRIPRKNLVSVAGTPLIGWSIRAALRSTCVGPGRVYVSTDDSEIASAAKSFGAGIIKRPAELSADDAWTEPVIQHAVLEIERAGDPIEYVVWMNACVPQLQSSDVDAAMLLMVENHLREVIAVNHKGFSNSAVRVLRRETLFQRRLSVRFGVLTLPYIDINTADDLIMAASILGRTPSKSGDGNEKR